MLFGLQEVALPSMSEAKRAWTLIQLLIRPRGRLVKIAAAPAGRGKPHRPFPVVLPGPSGAFVFCLGLLGAEPALSLGSRFN